jgi:alpha-ketoglutarate-dependent taurine dioxygenase
MTAARGPVVGGRTPVPLTTKDLVQPTGTLLPYVLRTTEPTVDPVLWATAERDTLKSLVDTYGAVLLRGFGVTLGTFGDVVRAVAGEPQEYVERSSPRTEVGDRIYTATDHPADQTIHLHNENSYQRQFPATLLFCCVAAPRQGGATPVADCRRVLARIEARVVAEFAGKGVRYVRNYGGGLGMSWQEAFQTGDRGEVERRCRDRGIDFEWLGDERLRTGQVRPAIAVHPRTGERVWFNHAVFFHATSLPAAIAPMLRDQLGADNLPATSCYGDGTPIEPDVMDHLRAAYRAESAEVPWQRGDLLVVDNLLAAHGRQPYSGDRKVVVGMAGPLSWDDVRDDVPA